MTTIIGEANVDEARITIVTVSAVDYLAVRFDIAIQTQGPVQLAALMDAIASKVPAGATKRVYPWPAEGVTVPCAVVGYPDAPIDFDSTFQRGSDSLTIPLFFMVGKATDRTARDNLSAVLTGATGIKDALDGALTTEA